MKQAHEQGEEMTREEAIRLGLVIFTKAEAAAFGKMTEQQRQVFLVQKRREYREQQHERLKEDIGAALEHPLSRLSPEDRRRERNRRKAERKRR